MPKQFGENVHIIGQNLENDHFSWIWAILFANLDHGWKKSTGYTITKTTLTILVKYTLDHAIRLGKDQQWQKQPKMTVLKETWAFLLAKKKDRQKLLSIELQQQLLALLATLKC